MNQTMMERDRDYVGKKGIAQGSALMPLGFNVWSLRIQNDSLWLIILSC